MKSDFTESADPFSLFDRWFAEAGAAEPSDPNAMSLATVDAEGMPNARMVLMKGFDRDGLVFYTNFESAKGRELLAGGKAAVCFYWKSLGRQVRMRGPVAPVGDAEADAYFASRARQSRLGAWASQQSRPLESRRALEKAVAVQVAKYPVGKVPRPPYWSGFRLTPVEIEFWKSGAFRLHERIAFRPDGEGWKGTRLYP